MNKSLTSKLRWWAVVLAPFAWSPLAMSAEFVSTPAISAQVDFDRNIRPIFEAACLRCHGPEKPRSKFRLDNAESALKGGSLNKNDIVPFKSTDSLLIDYVSGRDEEMKMPPAGKGEPLTPEQIATLRNWIDQGARWSSATAVAARQESFPVTPIVGSIAVTGNKQKYRADTGKTDGFIIGFSDFELKEPVGKESELIATGHAIVDQNDYQIGMTLTTPDLGFVDGGYSTYRKYFNDVGGYYAPFGLSSAQLNQPPFVLNQDLHVDNQKAWINFGLTLPNLPKFVVGYEYLSRSGRESTLNWSQYSTNAADEYGKAILPAYRDTTETTQVIKLDATYEVGGYSLEDNFRGEFYKLNQSSSTPSGSGFPAGFSAQDESYDHFQAVNVFRVEKQLRPWLFVSGGALYTHLNGNSSFYGTHGSTNDTDPSLTFIDQGQGITLKQTSHTINGNAMLGPWQGLTFSAGIQAEWEQREGAGTNFVTDPTPGLVDKPIRESSSRDKTSFQETFALRYTKIPFTVLYAEANFAQESYDLYEGGYDEKISDEFTRDSDSTVNLQQYRAGLTISPWQPVTLDGSYEYRDKRNNYNNYVVSVFPGGYPGFLRWLDITGQEVEARLTLRPCSWVKATLKYQWVSTEYRNAAGPSPPPFNFYPGGEILSGDSQANIYSINLTLTPVRRLYLSTSFSYSDTRTVSGINNYTNIAPSVVAPYEGHISSVLVSANYSLNKVTDLNASYAYSRANYQQDNLPTSTSPGGLPLGIVYDRNAVWVGITRRFTKSLTGRVQYAFTTYNEPSSAQVNNYRANAILCSMNIILP